MTRLELARMRFQQLAPELTLGADESRSDQLEAWLRDDVVPVIEDLLDNPVFRRRVLKVPEQLLASPATEVRAQIGALADAFVVDAQTIVAVAREFGVLDAPADHDRALDEAWLAEHATHDVDRRSVIEKIAERPWFDLVTATDFWAPGAHLHLRGSDSLLTRQFRRDHGQPELLGDHVVQQMFARAEFWRRRLDRGRRRLQGGLPEGGQSSYAARQRLFNCALDVGKKFSALRQAWHQGVDPRLRSACMTLLQTYIAYHEAPQLPWLGVDAQTLSVNGQTVRSFFRHRGTLTLARRESDGRLRLVGQRRASLVDVHLARRVAAALEDLAALYHQGVHADDLIAEAKKRFKLVVVVHPRMVFWRGDLLELDWGAEKAWNLMLHLAVKTEGKLPMHHFQLTNVHSDRALSIRKAHLKKFLGGCAPGVELAARLEKRRGGPCYLDDVERHEVKVLDLDADEWTIAASDFLQASR